jgi:hypothetical protein
MNIENAIDGSIGIGTDKPPMREPHGMERAFQIDLPELQKSRHLGKVGRKIVVLPNVSLENRTEIGQVVKDMSRGQTVAFQLALEVRRNTHAEPLDSS